MRNIAQACFVALLLAIGPTTGSATPLGDLIPGIDNRTRADCFGQMPPPEVADLRLNFREGPVIGKVGELAMAICASGGAFTTTPDTFDGGPHLVLGLPGGGDVEIDCRAPNGSFLRCDTLRAPSGVAVDRFFDLPFVAGLLHESIRETLPLATLVSGPVPFQRFNPRARLDQEQAYRMFAYETAESAQAAWSSEAMAFSVALTLRPQIFPQTEDTLSPEPLAMDLFCTPRLVPSDWAEGRPAILCIASLILRDHDVGVLNGEQLAELALTQAIWRAGRNPFDLDTQQSLIVLAVDEDALKLAVSFDLSTAEEREIARLMVSVGYEVEQVLEETQQMRDLGQALRDLTE